MVKGANSLVKVNKLKITFNKLQVYNTVVSEMASKALQGFNGTLLAYGQTGAGKTFTITGATENYKQRGAIPRAISQVLCLLRKRINF